MSIRVYSRCSSAVSSPHDVANGVDDDDGNINHYDWKLVVTPPPTISLS